MCGIIGYIGQQQAIPFLIDGLRRLEYRGYDSSGVAVKNGNLSVHKKIGKVADLEAPFHLKSKELAELLTPAGPLMVVSPMKTHTHTAHKMGKSP